MFRSCCRRPALGLVLALLAASLVSAEGQKDAGFQNIFDGQYGDFEVVLEMNNDFGPDSGLFLRSTETGKAYQAKGAAENPAVDALWAKIYDRPERLTSLQHPVVCLLDIQHRDIIRAHLEKLPKPENTGTRALRSRLKALSGLDCLVVHQSEVTGADLDRPMIKAILIGGRSKTAGRTKDEDFFPLIRTTKIPMIGICGGCQLIGSAFNSKTTSMRKLRPGEKDPYPKYHPGLFKEWGFLPVKVVKPDPLFVDLPETIVVREAHAYQMSVIPPEFELLASTAECRVEAVKHRQRLLYGVQFHPEVHDAEHRDGEVVLKNFFRLALAH